MSYNVLNMDWERITVDTIDPQIHRHLSGREFTENDACVKKKVVARDYTPDTIIATVDSEWDITTAEEMTREQAIEAYKGKYGRRPNWMMKTENIIAKL